MKTWEERTERWIKTQYGSAGDTHKLKVFIASELQKQKEEIVEMIKGMRPKDEVWPDSYTEISTPAEQQIIDDIIKKLEGK